MFRSFSMCLLSTTILSGALVLASWEARGQSVEDQSTELEPITVYGQAGDPEGPGEGILAKRSRTATKTDAAIIDTPQSISVITREQMDKQNARTVNEALRYTPGVAAEQWGGITAYDQLTIRGFNYTSTGIADTFLDGLRLSNGIVFGSQQVDPFLLERVEVLRGPASVLYGLASPGGVVALSSKLPVDQQIRLIELEGGTGSYGRASIDLGGRIDPEGTLLYRFAGTAYTRNEIFGETKTDRIAVAPSLTWRPDDATSLTLSARYQKEPHDGTLASLPAYGTLFPNPNGWLPIDTYPGEPDFNTAVREQTTLGYQFDHKFNDSWSISSRARYAHVDMDIARVILAGLQPDMRTIDRTAEYSKERFDSFAIDNALNGRFETGIVDHNFLLGLNYEYFDGRGDYGVGFAPPLDIYDPVYGSPISPTPAMMYMDNEVTSHQAGVYLQDQLSFGNWRASLGVRHDWSSIDTVDHLWGASFDQDDQATTVRAGLLYRFDNGVAPYFTYAQSFQPLNQVSASGEPFKPTRGELYEIGVKYQPDGWDGMLSAAVFNLTQDNTLTSDPNNPAISVQAGEVRSRGIELEARARLTDQFSFIGAFTWQDVEYTKDNSGWVGKTPLRVPSHFASAWLAWEAPEGTFSGLGAGVGVRYNGGTYGGTMASQFQTGNYTLVDAMVSYDFGKKNPQMEGVRLQVNATNLLNERYVAGCYSVSTGCFYGAGRTVTAKLSYQF